jgi:hypothetical protein
MSKTAQSLGFCDVVNVALRDVKRAKCTQSAEIFARFAAASEMNDAMRGARICD